MKVVKPNGLGILSRCYESKGKAFFSVAGLVFFAFGEGARLLTEQDLWKTLPKELGEEPLDLCMPKVRGEVLVTGKAYPPGGARPVCAVRVRLGSTIDKTLRVTGDRTWKRGVPTDPTPFREMPVTYACAFGGPGFERNPTGKGFAPVVRGLAELHELPNVEDPRALVLSPRDRREPAGLGAIDFAWPQRSSKAGTYDATWLKERYPGFADDVDWTIFQAAPADQWIEGFFAGDEGFSVEHMHPDDRIVEGRLPGVRVRAFVRFVGAGKLTEMKTRFDTVRLFPHLRRGVLLARGVIEVTEDDAHDVEHLVLAAEAMGAEKPLDHYEAVLTARLDKENGALASLRESDLMPARGRPLPKAFAPADEFAIEGRMAKRMRTRQENARKELLAKLTGLGVADAEKLVPELPPEPEVQDPEELGELVVRAREEGEVAKAHAEKRKAEAEQAARASFAARGLDYDAQMENAMREGEGPPRFSADAEMAKLASMARAAKEAGIPSPDLDALLANPATRESMLKQEMQVREAYQRFAHHFPAATRLEGDEASRLRSEVEACLKSGRPLAGRDLTGADLAGIDLTGAKLAGVLLENANLAGAALGGADLTGAVLARADLRGANLFGATLTGANLGAANLTEAELGSANLERATLAKSDLTGAKLRNANLEGADLLEAVLTKADLSHARAPQAIFLKADLGTTRFAGADLTKAVFVECRAEGTDFTGAILAKASMVTVHAAHADFSRADLTKASFVKGSQLPNARFAGATLEETNLRGTVLERAEFLGAVLAHADLSEAKLNGARLAKTRAHGAQFVRSDLTGADLFGIDLKDGSLQKACIAGADLRNANLFGVDLAKVRGDGKTQLHGANLKRARVVGARGVST